MAPSLQTAKINGTIDLSTFRRMWSYLEDIRQAVEATAEEYQKKLKEVAKEMKEELGPLRKRRDDILHAIQTEAENMAVELPELPEPEVEPDDGGWLYDSHRDYLEQLSHYKAHQNGTDEDPSPADEEDEAA